ncbi:MAG: pseudoazurin [Pseudomonadota bacterium]
MTLRMELTAAAAISIMALVAAVPSAIAGETIEVQILNFDPDDPSKVMVYKPEIVRANVGDTIKFVSVDAFHNAQSIPGMLPEGAEPFESPLSQDYEYVVTQEGTYGFLCLPHSVMGMAGLILVGDHTVNLEDAKAVTHSGAIQTKFDTLFAEIE